MPEWETVGPADFAPLAAYERFEKHVIGWKLLPGASSVAPVPRYSPHSSPPGSDTSADVTSGLFVRDPETFCGGEIHNHPAVWDRLSAPGPNRTEVMRWIIHRVSINQGHFGGVAYRSDTPVPRIFQNNVSCKPFADFISRTICERIEVGAVSVVGRVGECPPPLLVMPLTVEPNKPRLCQDQRYLNCWIKDMPFRLDSVIDLTCYVGKNHYQSKLDDKSGYDHVLMDDESRMYMGFQWGGWWFVNNVLPFGWKISPYIYQTLGMVATHELRRQHIPCSQYIDDLHLGQRRAPCQPELHVVPQLVKDDAPSSIVRASEAVSIAISIYLSQFVKVHHSSGATTCFSGLNM